LPTWTRASPLLISERTTSVTSITRRPAPHSAFTTSQRCAAAGAEIAAIPPPSQKSEKHPETFLAHEHASHENVEQEIIGF